MTRANTPETFWANVDVRGPDECWPWKLAKTPRGYGVVKYQMRSWRAHRLAWALTHGPIPPLLDVLHHCDNPPCCNPYGDKNLFLGTPADNSADMVAKERQASGERHGTRIHGTGHLPSGDDYHGRSRPEVMARGEQNGAAVLTEELVREIRRRHASGASAYRMAKEHGVAKGTIRFVIQGVTWKHVQGVEATRGEVTGMGDTFTSTEDIEKEMDRNADSWPDRRED